VAVGRVGAPHGVRGAFRLAADLDPGILVPGVELLLEGKSGTQSFKVLAAEPRKKGWLVRVEGVDTPEEAKKLSGLTARLDRTCFPPLEDGEYYWFDILGLSVFTSGGRRLGTVRNIIPTGANDVYEVVDEEGAETLVPALEWVIVNVDLSAGKMVVDLPEGL